MQQQFISQPAPYPVTSPLGVQSVIPQAQSVVPQIGAPAIYQAQSVAIPQVQSVVPQVVPQVQSVVPQVQSVVPQVVPLKLFLMFNQLEVDILLNKIT